MATYKVTINTDKYKCGKCSKKNWEPGTRNDYMIAINRLTRTLRSLREVEWQLRIFQGCFWNEDEYDIKRGCLSDRYEKFLKRNTIKYYDRLCGFCREQYLSGYGWTQGYFSIDKAIEELKAKGKIKIPFAWLYDIRQYDNAMNGCYMEIIKL